MSPAPKRVLLVEDDAETRYHTTVLLEAEGYGVTIATSGEAALARLDDEAFAFVLLDLQLPDGDGYEVARRIRSNPGRRDVPVIAILAPPTAVDWRRAVAAGCTGYVARPVTAGALAGQVRSLTGVPS